MAKSKYAEVVKHLAAAPAEDQSYQSKVDAVKAEIGSVDVHTPESLAKLHREAYLQKSAINDELYDLNVRIAALDQMLVESHDSETPGWGTHGASENTIRLASGHSLSVQYEPTAQVEDKDRFRQWCIDNGLANSLQLWPSTTAAITKERLLAGQPEPDGVKAYVKAKIVWRNPRS